MNRTGHPYEVRWPRYAGCTRYRGFDTEREARTFYERVAHSARYGLCVWAELWDRGSLVNREVWTGRQAVLIPDRLAPARRMVERAFRPD